MPIVVAEELEVGQPLPGGHYRYFHADNMSFEYYDVDEGTSIHEHFHVEEEVLPCCVSGHSGPGPLQ